MLSVVLSFVVGVGANRPVRVFGAVMEKRWRSWCWLVAGRIVGLMEVRAASRGAVEVAVSVPGGLCRCFVWVSVCRQGFEVVLTRGGTRRVIGVGNR